MMFFKLFILGCVLISLTNANGESKILEKWSKMTESATDNKGALKVTKGNYIILNDKFDIFFNKLNRSEKVDLLIEGFNHKSLKGIGVGETALAYGVENDDVLIIMMALESYSIGGINGSYVFDYLANVKNGKYLFLLPSSLKYGDDTDISKVLLLICSEEITLDKKDGESFYDYSCRMVDEFTKQNGKPNQ